MTLEEAQAMADLYASARNNNQLDLLDSIYAIDVVVTDPSMPDMIQGLDALKEFYMSMQTAFPDFHITFDQVHVANDVVIFDWTVAGTNTGQFGALPPSGKSVRTSGVAVSRVANGKIVDDRVYYDMFGVFMQMGYSLMPQVGDTASQQ
jgi:steroid delta-isomerase-like uncharacterized protein